MAEIKDLLRERLLELSKEELIDIIADISSVYIRASVLGKLSGAGCIQQCVNNVQTNVQEAINGMYAKIDVRLCEKAKLNPKCTSHRALSARIV